MSLQRLALSPLTRRFVRVECYAFFPLRKRKDIPAGDRHHQLVGTRPFGGTMTKRWGGPSLDLTTKYGSGRRKEGRGHAYQVSTFRYSPSSCQPLFARCSLVQRRSLVGWLVGWFRSLHSPSFRLLSRTHRVPLISPFALRIPQVSGPFPT